MKPALRSLALGLLLFLPISAAQAQVSVSPISDQLVNSQHTLTVNVVAVDPDGGDITLTASLPAFATLDEPTSGMGSVVTTLTLMPTDGDIGSHSGSVTATVGELSDTEEFQITVAVPDADQPPRVTAPAHVTTPAGSLLEFDVTAVDPDADPITTLAVTDAPMGASFSTSDPFTSGTFSWTPDASQVGHYDVIFSASNALSDSASTHIEVLAASTTPVTLDPIDDVAMAEGDSVQVKVIAVDPDLEMIALSASLPDFATLDMPTESSETDSLQTTVTIKPMKGDAGMYAASVTATAGEDIATEEFTITVTAPPSAEATATLIGAFNRHKKFLCFKVMPVDESFDLLDASLSSITLSFGEGSIPAVRPTHLAYDCDGDGEGDGDCDEDCDENQYGDGEHHDAATYGDDHGYGDDDQGEGGDGEDCEPSHIMACFDMDALEALFGEASLPDALKEATIQGDLGDGGSFTASIGGKHVDNGERPKDGQGDGDKKEHLSLRVKPNPMNPKADITFTLVRSERVRVAVYDLAGRLVGTIREGVLAAGPHTIAWDGGTSTGGHVASGVYFVSVETSRIREVQRVTVLK